MTATAFDAALPSDSFLFDIYNDGFPAQDPRALPGGPCNYTDPNLPRCGCRRFWSRQPTQGFGADQGLAYVCMCSHHACFHEYDHMNCSPLPSPIGNGTAGQENERPRSNREPLSPVPVQAIPSFAIPTSLGAALDLDLLNFEAMQPMDAVQMETFQNGGTGPKEDTPLPDTLSWGPFGSAALDTNLLPAMPAPCLMSPHPPSTVSSNHSRYLQPFGGWGLQKLGAVTATQSSRMGTPRPQIDGVSCPEEGAVAPASGPQESVVISGVSPESFQHLSNAVQTHDERLERHDERLEKLETASFSVAGQEDWQEKHDSMDVRVTDLESRFEQVESLLNENSSMGSGAHVRPHEVVDDGTGSVASMSMSAQSAAHLHSRVHALQAQVKQLQASSLPTYNSPWELEVVLLPFPLTGIWVHASDFRRPPLQGNLGNSSDEWMVDLPSRGDWLLPRAFPNGHVIDRRLRSRGLVQTVLVRGADARSVQLALNKAFETPLRLSADMKVGRPAAPDLAEFLGLRQAWVPLRKLHKDARLRFLSPAEMATPAVWDFAFLSSSVVMKATGMHRLYITQPEAYLQHRSSGQDTLDRGWTWKRLRGLSSVCPDPQSSWSGNLEDCWSRDEKLDGSSVTNANMSARQSRRSSGSSTQSFFTVPSPTLSTNRWVQAQSPCLPKDGLVARPPHSRTTSLPAAQPTSLSPSQSRRRVASHVGDNTHDHRCAPLMPRPSSSLVPTNTASRRGLSTRSPSLMPRNTPRLSRATTPVPGALKERANERRTTPFYYATPYSNAPFESHRAPSRGTVPGNANPDDDDVHMEDESDDRGSLTDPNESGPGDDDDEDDDENNDQGRMLGHPNRIDVYEDSDVAIGHSSDDDDPGRWTGLHQDHEHDAQVRPEDVPWQGIEDPMSDGENRDPDDADMGIHEYEDEDDDAQPSAGWGVVNTADRQVGGVDMDDCNESEASSVPSEYPSTQSAWLDPARHGLVAGRAAAMCGGGNESDNQDGGRMEFQIHEDDEDEGEEEDGGYGLDTQW